MKRHFRVHIGLRILKTAAAVILSMIIVNAFGTTDSRLIFAMLGAMAAVQTTFKDSVESSLTQIVGVLFGAVLSVGLLLLPIHRLAISGIGIILVITLYNSLGLRFSPSLPCLIVVTMCISPDIEPISYALGRVWDTTIGVLVGMLVNTLVFPYDNSRRIRQTIKSLDKELIAFLEELFDGDQMIPNAHIMSRKVDEMRAQLRIFENQKLFLRKRCQNRDIADFRLCEKKARELAARMEVLCHMECVGRLNDENRHSLEATGANIMDERPLDSVTERDVITNYHVRQILTIRRQLLQVLEGEECQGK